jgi:hypothetical protein
MTQNHAVVLAAESQQRAVTELLEEYLWQPFI